jgi:YD repeat-containing protein
VATAWLLIGTVARADQEDSHPAEPAHFAWQQLGLPDQSYNPHEKQPALKIAEESGCETKNGIEQAVRNLYGEYGLDFQLPPPGSSSYEAYCPNYWGASFDVPFGHYDGNRLMGVVEDEGPTFAYWRGGVRTNQYQYDGSGGGWAFAPGATLYATVSTLWQSTSPPNGSQNYTATCKNIIRFTYIGAQGQTSIGFAPLGAEQVVNFMLSGGSPPSCSALGSANTDLYNLYWSNEGQILLDVSTRKSAHPAPVLHFPDGTIEVFASLADGGVRGSAGPLYTNGSTGYPYEFYLKQRIDPNGNVTSFNTNEYAGGSSGHWTTVTDPQGRVTTYQYANTGRLSTITTPGPNGGNLVYAFNWATYSWNSSPLFPDVTCLAGGSPTTFPTEVACGSNVVSYTTLASMTLPDGRSYQFGYADPSGTTLWGALTQVTRPDGSVHRFGYGNSSTPDAILPPDWQDIGESGLSLGHGGCPHQGPAVHKRRVVSETEYPNGLGAAGYTTTLSQDIAANWITRTRPDGSVDRHMVSTNTPVIIAQEQWTKDPAAGGVLVEGIYNTYAAERFGVAEPYLVAELDIGDYRVTRIKHVRDGATW